MSDELKARPPEAEERSGGQLTKVPGNILGESQQEVKSPGRGWSRMPWKIREYLGRMRKVPASCAAYICLLSHVDTEGMTFIGVDRIADEIGYSRAQTYRAIAHLQDLGLVIPQFAFSDRGMSRAGWKVPADLGRSLTHETGCLTHETALFKKIHIKKIESRDESFKDLSSSSLTHETRDGGIAKYRRTLRQIEDGEG